MSYSPPDIARQIAAGLLEIGAIRLSPAEPFIWASGWKSPIYCDNRLALSYPVLRNRIKEGLCDLVKAHYPGADAIAGVATAGIPQGALVADALQLPFAYVRSKPKEHGLSNQIEGRIVPGQRVVVVEDLISTGSSSIAAGLALRQCGATVLGMVAIFTYEFELAAQNFAQNGLPLHCLSSYSALLAEAAESGAISESEAGLLARWRESPSTWGNS
jgi:orotate phosphoribosyltransferase